MDTLFVIKLVLTFLVGSTWLSGATLLAERFGSKIGGVIAGMPASIVIALFFIGWTQTPLTAAQATVVVPLVMGFNSLFVVLYVALLQRGFALAVLVGLAVWFACSLTLALTHFDNFVLSLLGFGVLIVCSYLVMEYILRVKATGGRAMVFSFRQLLLRGLIGGSIVTLAVVLAKVGGPLFGGVFASFPAVFLSSMILTYLAQGKAFSVSVMKPLMLSGTINTTLYGCAVRVLYPPLGLVWGTLCSFLLSLIGVYLVYLLVKRMA